MYPWGHLAVGYLCYSIAIRLRYRRPPDGQAVLALGIGTQFPDLIDKPLSWTFGILPSGRSMGHSLVFATLLGIVVWYVVRQYDRRTEAVAFFCGHLLHIVGDALPIVLAGRWERLGMVLWPVIPAYQSSGEPDQSIIEFFLSIDLATIPIEGVFFITLTTVLWLFDGLPGIKPLVDRIQKTTEASRK
jgi:hypothetical protein